MEKEYGRIIEFVKANLGKEKVSGMDHAERVYSLCEQIGKQEGADLEVLRVAAIMHDVAVPAAGRAKHFEVGARMAEKFLREMNFPEDKIRLIVHAIEAHSRFGGPDPQTKEAKILYDADLIDYIGAIGIIRAVGRGLASGEFTGDIKEAVGMLRKMTQRGKFYTRAGEEIAKRRFEFMEQFIEELNKELKGEA